MANGKIRFGKQSGGKLALVIPDGVSNTEVVVPESGVLATQAYADGKTTLAQVKNEICTGSNLVTSSTGAVGYRTGAGGTVTQLTSKSTSVTLNKPTGTITMHNADLAAGASVYFNLFNTNITLNDTVMLMPVESVTNSQNYKVEPFVVTMGGVGIKLTNISAGSLSEAFKLNFCIIKGAIS